ncbi:MAG TPA: glycosyltransferase family 4 protein [Candidatus Angelobacter sp.]|jgi:glycosyltransferase involved in cell wall biosynthesis|nr:glycosyltransferase family 4 protein [Candidatus Angelobacter sp.]
MKIALVAPPFIAVPPRKYGGTELFVAELAEGLQQEGAKVVLYANGESTVSVETRWIYEQEDWPLESEVEASLKGISHSAWAVQDAAQDADVIHVNSAPALSFSHFVEQPFVYTVHHVYEQPLAEYYARLPKVQYVTISDFQQQKLRMPHMRTIHHGLKSSLYQLQETKQPYLCFLGRVAPPKGTHLAIEIAKRAGIALKIAGEIQPIYQQYWETQVQPHVDGKFIEYVGELGPEEKNELLGNAMALLFPIQWDEPFGLVMIEAMACGTPVLAMPGGSVAEVVKEGAGGHVRNSVNELADCARNLKIAPRDVRRYMEENFSVQRMARDYLELYSDIASGKAQPSDEEESMVA